MSSRRELLGALDALLRLIDVSDSLDVVRKGSVLSYVRAVANRAERGLIDQMPWTPFEELSHQPPSATQVKALMQQHGCSEETVLAVYQQATDSRLYVNSRYQVTVRRTDDMVYLSIKRIDQMPIHDWRDLQRIKDELVGVECEAVELYPARSRVVDTSNQYHLWAVQDANFRFPFGFDHGAVTGDQEANAVGAAQRVLRP